MITCNLMGGLGNQLFQIFATISCAIKNKQPFKFIDSKEIAIGFTKRYTFWYTFLLNLKPFLIKEMPTSINAINEKGFLYNELNIEEFNGKDIIICGYFQSYKYFQDNFQTICKLIGLNKLKENLLVKLNSLNSFSDKSLLDKTISMHFRLGDYKNFPDHHPILSYEYYKKALNTIKNIYPNTKFTIYYFCEDEDITDVLEKINRLKKKFKEFIFIRGENKLDDWEQLLFMSCCHHNIIANSTFSWWAAYFNNNVDKIVCYPSVWFGPAVKKVISDLFPPDWVIINL